jgi:YidC/Oxa1 family membrane protein insertase
MWNTIILQPMINALLFLYQFLGTGPNTFGWAIIIFTIFVRVITLPFTYQQMKSSMIMQELQGSKKWKKIQEKYKDDRQKLAEEQMKLYQEHGYNPFSGCLPTLLNLPIILGLYQAVIRTMAATPVQLLDLSKLIYPFTSSSLIPLNSTFFYMNLGQPERLPLPFLEGISFLDGGLPLLAILVAVTSYFQAKVTTPPTSTDQQGAGMMQMMTIYMPLIMGYFAFAFSSGLALYLVVSNVLGIVQGVITRRLRENATAG